MARIPAQPFAADDGPIVFGHRGGGGRWPENTMLGFRKAQLLGVDALELDIHSTADGTLVVIHDDVVDRVTNGQGAVNRFTLPELKALDAGYRWTEDGGQTFPFRGQGLTIPTLAEVFEAFPDMWINIDVKQADPPIVAPFVEMLRAFNMVDRVCVGSFTTPTVAAFRAYCPEAATVATVPEVLQTKAAGEARLSRLAAGRPTAVQLPEVYGRFRIITPAFVRAAHRRGVAVHVWTVNDIPAMRRLLSMGVDGLMTDYPDLLLRLLGRLQQRQRVTLIIVREDEVLLIRRQRSGRTYSITPGGGVEPGETLVQAAMREVTEETGLSVSLGPQLWRRQVDEQEEIAFLITDFSGTPALGGPELASQSADNTHQLTWVPLAEANAELIYPGPIDMEMLWAALRR